VFILYIAQEEGQSPFIGASFFYRQNKKYNLGTRYHKCKSNTGLAFIGACGAEREKKKESLPCVVSPQFWWHPQTH